MITNDELREMPEQTVVVNFKPPARLGHGGTEENTKTGIRIASLTAEI
jgi:hypothetical protein